MSKFLWIDLEMTGLNDSTDHIIEVAAMVTEGKELNVLSEFHRVVFQPPQILAAMDEWCTKTHTQSGLVAQIPHGKALGEVEKELIEYIEQHFDHNRVILAGNSIGQDRRFIDRYMPLVAAKLHYRMVDISSFKEVFKEFYGWQMTKKNTHRAVDDIRESIAELKYYLGFVQATTK